MSDHQHPYSFDEAKAAIERSAVSQREAMRLAREEFVRAKNDYAAKEKAYRIALALKITELKAGGVAWTVCGDLARGDEQIATLRMRRDIADGIRESALEALKVVGFTHAADRREVEQLVTWSMRVAPDGQFEEALRSVA